ncbi:MAG: TRAP transporter substrate-binding protein [Candidatus Velthaea sp.]
MGQHLSRGQFAAGTAAVFASVGVIQAPAKAAQFEYKMAHNLPVSHPLHVRNVQLWNAVRKETNGRLDVKIFPNNLLGGDTQVLGQLRVGAVQFFTLSGGILTSVVDVAAIQGVGFAFKDSKTVFEAMDGAVGAIVRKETEAKGLYAFDKIFENGFRQITSSSHPITKVEDLANFKIRTPPGKLWVDLFKTLGASPTPINLSEVYTAMQTKVVDGQENPYAIIETAKFYEVQKYLSQTNHMWDGYWLLANGDAFKALPPDIQEIVKRNARKYADLQRRDVAQLNDSLSDKLSRRGMIVNKADTSGFRARLGPFYQRWKAEFGETAWSALEKYSGKLA